jgi:hypothetical protein
MYVVHIMKMEGRMAELLVKLDPAETIQEVHHGDGKREDSTVCGAKESVIRYTPESGTIVLEDANGTVEGVGIRGAESIRLVRVSLTAQDHRWQTMDVRSFGM